MSTVLLLSLLACRDRDDTGNDTDTDTEPFGEVTATNSTEISTVITVAFDSPDAATCHIELGPAEGDYPYSTASETEPRTSHSFVVAGFPVRTTSHWRASCDAGGTITNSADYTFEGGQPPPEVPATYVSDVDLSLNAGGYRIVPTLGGASVILVVNASGELVWWHEADPRLLVLAAHPSVDGQGLWWNLNDKDRQEDVSTIDYARWDLADTRSITTHNAHHDFALLPDHRGFAYIEAEFRDMGAHDVVGDDVVLIDEDGTNERRLWSGWDAIPVPDFTGCQPGFYPTACDWTHANNIHYDDRDDSYYLSLNLENTFVHILSDGSTDWFMGTADYADYTPSTPDAAFVLQHGVKPWPYADDTYLMFDNGEHSGPISRGLRVRSDGASQFSVDWEFSWDGTHKSELLGDADPVGEDGNVLLSWGSEGLVTEVTEDGQIVFMLSGDLGVQTAFVAWSPTLGGPL